MRKSILWRQVLEGKVETDGPFGTRFQVTGLGNVFVTDYDRNLAQAISPDAAATCCNLVTMDEPCPDATWTIVGFQQRRDN